MKIYKSISEFRPVDRAVITIGTFDGVHQGHRQVIKRVRKEADDCNGEVVLLTFYPHPRKVVNHDMADLKLLTTMEERSILLDEAGVDHLIIQNFTNEFSQLEPEEFITQVLYSQLKTHILVVGYDHRFGKDRKGSFDDLVRMAPDQGFVVEKIPQQEIDDAAVSSTRIRTSLKAGDVAHTATLLGRKYSLSGTVVEGSKLGRKLGFPTANIEVDPDKLIPANGVYIVSVKIGSMEYDGLVNIGIRPTVESAGEQKVEVYIMEFSQDIYNEKVVISFISRIRDEMKFGSVHQLKEQMQRDLEFARQYLKERL